jgi:hypothetical protein
MAIDSVGKRASALYFVGHRKGRLIPDGTIVQPDFQNIVGFYSGIQAAVPAGLQTVTLLSAVVSQPVIAVSCPNPSITASTPQPTITISEKNDIT